MRKPSLDRYTRGIIAAIGLPILATIFYRIFVLELHPYVWFLYYPAIFIAAWFAGVRAGLFATVFSTALALIFLVPEEPLIPHGTVELFPAAIFVAVGSAVSVFHARVRQTNVRLAAAVAERRMFAALVENSSDFIGVADPAGRLIYVNPAGRQMIGMPGDVVASTTQILDYYAPAERDLAEEVILKSTIELGRWRGETLVRHWTTGAAIPVSDTVFLIRDPATTEVLGIGTMKRDISDRKRLERELATISSELVRAQAVAEVGSWQLDSRRGEIVWSDETYRIFGRPLGTPVTYETFLACVHPDDRDRVDLLWQDALRGGSYDTEHRIIVAGETRWVREKAEVTSDATGTREIGIVHDITARKRLEADLRLLGEAGTLLSETLDYEATLTNLAQLVVRDLADFCVIDVVREELQRVKVASHDPANAWICDELMRVRLEHRPLLLQEAIDSGASYIVQDLTPEKLALYAQSEAHLAALKATNARSTLMVPLISHGKLLGALGLLSSHQQYSTTDLALVSELARRAALSIEQAYVHQVAKRAIQSRDDVLSIVAHDLRNPLNTIRLQTELLRVKGGPGERDRAASIDRAAVRMDRLIQDLLDVTRIEGGALVLDRRSVPTRNLLSEIVDAQRPAASAASLELQLDSPEALPDVWADRNRVQQICENLIGNAVKFTPPGGRISVGALPRDHEVMFWVADTGEGMDQENLPHVFDRFWQAHESHRTHGAGLGLPIVKGLVEAHGGRVWVESARNRGTTFFFTLPCARAPAEASVAR
jgi:PAS domain S-box-containing protein